jgi:hypothetical protein
MASLPADYPEADKPIMRQELINYFSGNYDKAHIPDLDTIDNFLRKTSPDLVRH